MSNIGLLPRYTYEDYLQWEGDWELIEGIPVSMAPAPMRIHQQIAGELFFAIKNELECEECEVLYETDWKLSNETLLRPDIVVVCGEDNERYITKAPRIIFEILSPSTAKKDETVKYNIYEDERVEYYILVYPDDLRAKAYRLGHDGYRKVADFTREKLVFEGLECDLAVDFDKVFQRFRNKER